MKKKTRMFNMQVILIWWKKNLADLMNENLVTDPSINNASSIAFIFEYQNIKLAFFRRCKTISVLARN